MKQELSMGIRGTIATFFVILFLGAGGWFTYKNFFKAPSQIFFKTQKLEKHDIYKIVNAEGSLEAQGTLKIGSLISAKVKKIHVKEGDKVTKDQLLAELENDVGGDANVRLDKAQLKKAKADLEYKAAVYKRESELFHSGQIAKEFFEKTTADYVAAQSEVERTQAAYDKALFQFKQAKVHSPIDGIIVSIPVKEGQTFSPSNATSCVLFEIARDLSTMKATLAIDENNMGNVRVGMQAKISVDAYPYKKAWKGKIISLGTSKTTQQQSSTQSQQGQSQSVTYQAEVILNNADNLLRPDMTVHAKITIAKAKQALAVPGFVFQLNSKVLEEVAKKMHYEFKPIDPAKKKELGKQQDQLRPTKFLWVVDGKSFVEKSVVIGVTDNAFFQVLSGVTEAEDIIADDMTASDEMKKIAKQIAGN
jgi:RND family efflux transporter MFP subunit